VLNGTSGRVIAAGLGIAAIALVDWRVDLDVAFGFLYLFPIILVGTVLPRWQIALVALLCTSLADLFDPYPFVTAVSVPHDILVFTSLTGTGFFAHAVTRSRRLEMEHLEAVEREAAARREAEEQLEFLVNTSPAALLTMTAAGEVLMANAAAHRLFGARAGALPGRDIRRYISALGRVPSRAETAQSYQSEMQCRGVREGGEVFLADVFFSTYQTALGPRLAALIVDASEALREREVSSLEQLLASSRILMGAVFHEVRNVCSAMAIIHENLVRSGRLAGDKDFEGLGALVGALTRIASAELRHGAETSDVAGVDLAETLADLRIVLDPYCEESGIEVHWEVPPDLPAVWADRHRLLQVFLNLMKNSERALAEREEKRINVIVSARSETVSIRMTDTGPGLGAIQDLFTPFQKGAASTGLGLYLSRALLRSFHADLRHDPAVPGCSFIIDLALVQPGRTALPPSDSDAHGTNPVAVG
jgi:two-component system, LuxR family, sensor kinase FixL